ncbi:TetR/AcrR family transcriptional regulator [Pengzhenrongella phosphoraccumulans]|uniref:TetR/AcrR family transcriptional regulator n=1 Tax=Pengzhenrongella phosphoraccumulans TaxID=3114394 RepID=UPI00388E7E7F
MRAQSDAEQLVATTKRGLATRARIVEVAADLVWTRGASGTTLDDVLDASRTSKSQMYHYFTDKDALVTAVARRQVERVVSAQSEHLILMDTLDLFREWGQWIVAGMRERGCVGGCPMGSLASELAEHSETDREVLARGFHDWHGHLARSLTAMRDSGELRSSADPDALATAVLAAVQGGLLLAQTARSTKPLEAAIAMAEQHVRQHARPGGADKIPSPV